MTSRFVTALLSMAMGAAWTGATLAQSAADLNPAVNTSPTPAATAEPATTAGPTAAGPAGPDRQPAAAAVAPPVPAAAAARSRAARPRLARAAAVPAAPASASPPASTPGAAGSSDRIELGTTEISGNRELPKLMYIVPWQRAQVGKITGRPPNSLVDEVLTPVDRSVFERQNSYYAALQAASTSAPSQPAAPGTPPAAAAGRDEK